MANVEELLDDALSRGDEGDWEGMLEVLDEGLEEYPDDPFLLCWRGVAEREMGLTGAAYDTFRECLDQQPEDPHVLAIAGNAIAAFDDPEAESTLRLAALSAPELPLARCMYGAYLAREGQLERALEELDEAKELAPDDASVAVERGVALALADRLEEAVDEFDRATRLDPEDGWVRVLLGLTLVELDDWEGAAGELLRGARLREGDVRAEIAAALASVAAGYEDEGYEMLERARLHAEGPEEATVQEAADRIYTTREAARELLLSSLAPTELRERLMVRP